MKPIRGPADAPLGALVEHTNHGAYRPTRTIVRVVSRSATRLTVLFPNGNKRALAYTRKIKTGSWRRTAEHRPVFQLLEPIDLWRRDRPHHAHVNVVDDKSVVIMWEGLLDAEERREIQEHLDALAAWVARKPKDTP